MSTAECHHTITMGRKGEKGSWCVACGEKVLEVETRPCESCAHYRKIFAGAVCTRHHMAVSPIMLVTFKTAVGTCWETKSNDAITIGECK